MQPYFTDDDAEAQRGHMFVSELNDKYHLHQGTELALRKKKICSRADEVPKKRQHIASR